MSEIAREVASILLEIGAVAVNTSKPYRYASGILSPVYCDNRLIMGYPEKRKQITEYFKILIEESNLEFDVVAATATAGIPHAAWLAHALDKPMIYIRGSSKEHGRENRIEGLFEEGRKVLVVEDLISTGGSSFSAVQAVRDAGCSVAACIAIFTYGLAKAKKLFSDGKCKLFTLSDFSTLIDVAAETKYLNEGEKKTALAWNKDPENWGKKEGFEKVH